MRPSELGESARRDLLACVRRGNQVLSGIDFWIPLPAWSDTAVQQRAVDATRATIELAADLERCPVSLLLPDPERHPELHEAVRRHAERFAVPLADHTPGAADAVSAPGIGVDPVASFAGGGDPVEAVSRAGDRLVSARLADLDEVGQRVHAGQGRLDLVGYKVALSLSPLQHLVVDLHHMSDPVAALQAAAGAWDAAGPTAPGW